MRRFFQFPQRTEIGFAAILLLGLLAMTARNAVDPDLWWHLRTGQWIVETGHVPHSDPFSFTRAGEPWVSHEWLSEVVFYELWKHGGAVALIVFSAMVTTLGFMLLYLRCLPRGGRAALGSRRDYSGRFGCRSLLGCAAADVHLYAGQPAAMDCRTWRASSQTPVLDTTSFSSMVEPARRVRTRPGAIVGLWCRPDDGNGRRQHDLARGASHPSTSVPAFAGLFGARSSQPQRRTSLSLSVSYLALVRDAVVHWRVALTGFSRRTLSPAPARMAAASDRTCEFPFAAQRDVCWYLCF